MFLAVEIMEIVKTNEDGAVLEAHRVTLELWGPMRGWERGHIMTERSPWNQVAADRAQSETIKY